MINPTENDWSRFHRIREDLSELPSSGVRTRIDQLRRDGESPTVISMLELHYRLAPAPELRPGRRLANRYTLKEKIGEGGMGVVYEAVQELTQQEVALKVIHPALASPSLIQRFREEIRTLGKLQHDRIVRVFDADYDRDDVGDHDLLFYAMQLVQGLPLMRWVNEAQPTVEARLECFIQICEAVDYAHAHGVVHRDLKPDNILVDAGGRPAILDFGLAQIAGLAFEAPKGPVTPEERTVLQVSGTPAFLSPERWDGQAGGVPADVFALGVLLHEVLTGTRPWRVAPDASINDLRKAICSFSADQLREHPALGRALMRLVGLMLASDPAARPSSAAKVAEAIRTALARRRLKRRIRRLAPMWMGVAVALGTVVGTRSYYAWLERQKWDSESRLREAKEIVWPRERGDALVQAIRLLPSKPSRRYSPDKWRDVVLEAMCSWNLRSLHGLPLPGGFDPTAGSPSGACFFGRLASGSWGLLERVSGAWVSKPFPRQQAFLRIRLNPRQRQLVALAAGTGLLTWDWKENRETTLVSSAEPDTQFEFSPDGRYLACSATISGAEGAESERLAAVRVFDTESWREVALLYKAGDEREPGTFLYVRSRPVAGLAFSPDGKWLATWSRASSYLLVWQWSEGRLVHIAAHPDRLAGAAWRPHPVGTELASAQADGRIRVWSLPLTTSSVVYLDLEQSIQWGQATGYFEGQITWTADGEALAAVDVTKREMGIFAADGEFSGSYVPLGEASQGGVRWLSDGLVTLEEGGKEWVRLNMEPPVHRVLKIPDFSPNYLSFNPAGTILAAADSTRMVLIGTTSRAVLANKEIPLSGPIAFDATTGDLWAYHKIKGPIRWTASEATNAINYASRSNVTSTIHVGQLAVNGGHLIYSWGTNLVVRPRETTSDLEQPLINTAMGGSPQQLTISADGRLAAALWWNPVRAQLWERTTSGSWVSKLTISNSPLLASLPEWNRDPPLTVDPFRQRTIEEKHLRLESTHFGDAVRLTAAADLPLVSWLRDRDQAIHVDYLGGESCVHVVTLPTGRGLGFHTTMALSPTGTRLATANSRGEIHLWDLRRTFQKLAELQLGIHEIELERLGSSQESPTRVTLADPG